MNILNSCLPLHLPLVPSLSVSLLSLLLCLPVCLHPLPCLLVVLSLLILGLFWWGNQIVYEEWGALFFFRDIIWRVVVRVQGQFLLWTTVGQGSCLNIESYTGLAGLKALGTFFSLFSSWSCCSFFFSSFALCLSLFQSSSDQSDSMGEGCWANWAQKGQGGPHCLHILQEDVIGGLVVAILWLVAMVVVVVMAVNLAVGNGAHKFGHLFALDGAKHPISTFLCFLFPFDLSLDLLEEGFFFINWMGLGWNGLFSSFFSSSYASIFFLERREWFHPSMF